MTVLKTSALVAADDMAPLHLQWVGGATVSLVGGDAQLRSAYLRTLAGAQYPLAGEVELLGHKLSTLDDRRWLALRCEVGLVTREAPLVSSLGVLRNVMLPAMYHGLGTRGEIAKRARTWLERLGFEGPAELLPAFLPERDRKIAALARALMLSPKLLFVDDPLYGLPASQAQPIAQALHDCCRELDCTLAYATDDADFMRLHAEQILFIVPPAPRPFASWQAFRDAPDDDVQRYLSEFRSGAGVFD
jgi:putative ABC transport system ATP-binding protein